MSMRTTQLIQPLPPRKGSTLIELIVAAGLLVTSISLLATGTVAGLKLQRLEHQQAVATDELSNQMEHMLTLSPLEAAAAIGKLKISAWAQLTLPDAKLEAEIVDDEHGPRVVMQFQWARTGEAKPLVAVGWLDTANESLPNQTTAVTGDADEA